MSNNLRINCVPSSEVVSQEIVSAPNGAWWKFAYNGKPRVALVLGEDPRGIGCLQCITPDGIRSMKPEKMIGIQDFTVLGDGCANPSSQDI